MARKKIDEYFDLNDPPVFVGGYVPASLKKKAKPILKAKHLVYADVFRAALKMVIDDNSDIFKKAKTESKYKK